MARAYTITQLLFFVFLSVGAQNSNWSGFVRGCYEAERDALLKFKQSVGDPVNRLASWQGMDCCGWLGVQCSNVTGYVTGVSLRSFLLSAKKLDSSLFELSQLNYLDLSMNDFQGSQVPGFIGSFKNLKYLYLADTNFSMASTQIETLFSNSTWFSGIEAIDISSNSLQGPFPRVFANMSSLRWLDLSYNMFTGSIPLWLRNLRQLEYLYLIANSFSRVEEGIVLGIMANPSKLKSINLAYNLLEGELANLHRNLSKGQVDELETLFLEYNKIEGKLPYWLGDLKMLSYMDMSNNRISGEIPSSIGKLSNLEHLSIWGNALNGRIPSSINGLASLLSLDLSYNSLSGNIPQEFGQLKTSISLDLSSNLLKGVLSDTHLANLSSLKYLSLGNNSLRLNFSHEWKPPFQLSGLQMKSCTTTNGELPLWLKSQTQLESIDLSNSGITGELPQWFWNMNLARMFLSDNQIEGTIGNLSYQLYALDLSNNSLSGSLSQGESMCQLNQLERLYLQNNNLTGTIPDCWTWKFLRVINLSSNKLFGRLPKSIAILHGLEILDLGENQLSGDVPNISAESHPFLEVLRLRSNNLVGIIPEQLCTLPSIKILDLASNNLTGNIPSCFGHFAAMELPASPRTTQDLFPAPPVFNPHDESTSEVLKGEELLYTRNLKFVENLDLSCNGLGGSIPESIVNLTGLIGLNLSHNHLTGNIPKNIGEMRSLESIDLSNNYLYGTIPSSMSSLSSLSHLNLSNNELHGEIPTGNQLQTLNDPSIYSGNPGLCGELLPNKCETKNQGQQQQQQQQQEEQEQRDQEKEDNREKAVLIAIVMVGVATGFWGVIGCLFIIKRFRLGLFKMVDNITESLITSLCK